MVAIYTKHRCQAHWRYLDFLISFIAATVYPESRRCKCNKTTGTNGWWPRLPRFALPRFQRDRRSKRQTLETIPVLIPTRLGKPRPSDNLRNPGWLQAWKQAWGVLSFVNKSLETCFQSAILQLKYNPKIVNLLHRQHYSNLVQKRLTSTNNCLFVLLLCAIIFFQFFSRSLHNSKWHFFANSRLGFCV
jgi:hypothetical protein